MMSVESSYCTVRKLWLYEEILAFIFTTSGWILVTSTLPTEYWRFAALEGVYITTNIYFANLWKVCVTDFTGLSNCKDYPSMLALDGYIQACRGLMISAVCLGLFGSAFALVGMKCTKIGGSDKKKALIACVAGVNFILCGLCSLSGCSIYAHKIMSDFFDPNFVEVKYELGAALFIGWGGAFLCIVGGCMLCVSLASNSSKSNKKDYSFKSPAFHSSVSVSQRPPSNHSKSSRKQHTDRNSSV